MHGRRHRVREPGDLSARGTRGRLERPAPGGCKSAATSSGVADDDAFGQSVSLSGDGARFAAGAHLNDDGGDAAGHVRVYQYDADADAWTAIGTVEDGTVLDGEAAADESGFCVSLSEDGERVAVGAPQNDAGGLDAAGHVRVFGSVDSPPPAAGTRRRRHRRRRRAAVATAAAAAVAALAAAAAVAAASVAAATAAVSTATAAPPRRAASHAQRLHRAAALPLRHRRPRSPVGVCGVPQNSALREIGRGGGGGGERPPRARRRPPRAPRRTRRRRRRQGDRGGGRIGGGAGEARHYVQRAATISPRRRSSRTPPRWARASREIQWTTSAADADAACTAAFDGMPG